MAECTNMGVEDGHIAVDSILLEVLEKIGYKNWLSCFKTSVNGMRDESVYFINRIRRIGMRKDVGIIKGYLKKFFPNNIIQVSYIKGKGVLSADGILIKTDVSFEEIKNKLQSVTKYMYIIKSNELYMERGVTAVNPQILECEYTDAEYIKIKEI